MISSLGSGAIASKKKVGSWEVPAKTSAICSLVIEEAHQISKSVFLYES